MSVCLCVRVCVYVCVSVCVYERERERESAYSGSLTDTLIPIYLNAQQWTNTLMYYALFPVAHSEVHGYGFRAYEYLPEPSASQVAGRQHAAHGMYSLRSMVLPRVYAGVIFLVQTILDSAASSLLVSE